MRFTSTAALLAAAMLCSPTLAEPPATQPPQDPLKGPTVTDRAPQKGKGQPAFGEDSIVKKKPGNKPAPPPSMGEFLKTLDVLASKSAPAAARLTSEQSATITATAAEFETATKSYMDKNKAELDALRAKLTPNDRNMLDQQLARGGQIKLSKSGFGGKSAVLKAKGKQPNAPDAQPADDAEMAPAPTKDEAAKTRSRIVEIYAGRPKVEDVQARILGLLTPEQLPLVDAELTKLDARHELRGAKKRPGRTPPTPQAPPAAPKAD